MSRLMWVLFLLGGYVWMVTSGHEQVFLDRGKAVYKMVTDWLEDADIDYHMKPGKKKSSNRRWK